MCGIVGIAHGDTSKSVAADALSRMREQIRHRGPDDCGMLIDGNIGIAMRRLSVIDVEGGKQPQSNEDDTCHIVHNGEIYNHLDLRRLCEARGHCFTTQSDTEAILHMYEDHADECPRHLNGMFAFAVHDSREHTLFLARDRLGIKPLYYAILGEDLVFGSEIKALLAYPDVPRDLDPIALDQYLAYKYVPGPRTIFRSIRKLQPGNTLTWKDGQIRIHPFWRLSFQESLDRPEEDLASELEDRLARAVEMQMISDVPLGALLSGGLDSSLIVALMTRYTKQPVKTFSIGFEERSFSELEHARSVSRHFGTDHHELVVRPDVRHLFEDVVTHFDEPFGDSSAVPTFLVSQLAREHVTVALSGTGGDELFAGYERYWAIPLGKAYSSVPLPARRMLNGLLGVVPCGHQKKSLVHRARRFVASADDDLLTQHRGVISLFAPEERRDLYTPEWQWVLESDADDPLESRFRSSDATSDLDRLLDVDTGTLLADDYLVKDDRMSMAVSLELRVPMLDHTLVEYAASLPHHAKLRGLRTKYLLRKAAENLLPKAILKRPKQGFELPIASWLGRELRDPMHDLLLAAPARERGVFRPHAVDEILQRHTSGRENLSGQIWAMMALEAWFRQQVDMASPPAEALQPVP